MNFKTPRLLLALVVFAAAQSSPLHKAQAQAFLNMGFETAAATITPTPPYAYGGEVDPKLAFVNWTVVAGFTLYNDLTLGTPAVDLIGPMFPNALNWGPLQGSYSVVIQNFNADTNFFTPASISQTGTIPGWAKSITFQTFDSMTDAVVTLDGVPVPLAMNGTNSMAGDISAFSGKVAKLTFSSGLRWLYFDNVQFLGTRFATPSPQVAARLITPTTLLLSWPATTSAFSLQQNSDLASTNWITLPDVATVIGSLDQMALPAPQGIAYFRLIAQ